MGSRLIKLSQFNAKITNQCFILYKVVEAILSRRRKIKILFSKQEDNAQELMLLKGFKFTQHEITFDEFSCNKILEHDIAIPLKLNDLLYLSKERYLFNNKLIPISSIDIISLCNDKFLLNNELILNGFEKYIPAMGNALVGYPFILKKRYDYNGINSYLIRDEREKKQYHEMIGNQDYFTQEFINGCCEYATHILFKDKKIQYSLTIKFKFYSETPIKGKSHLIFIKVSRCPYLDIFSAMLSSVGFEGLCCVNYKVRNKNLFVFEINPRMGGTAIPLFFSFMQHVGLPREPLIKRRE